MKNYGGIFDLDHAQEEFERLTVESQDPNFWIDAEKAQERMREKGKHQNILETMSAEKSQLDDAETLIELGKTENDPALFLEALSVLENSEDNIQKLEMMRMLNGENDQAAAIISINPGAGGTESQDWAQMLYRMLIRYCERKQFHVELLDYQDGEEAGLKSATLEVKGEFAYGLLKAEIGVHRLVRISPFDANARRHTSFASVFVYPEIDDDIQIDINDADIRIDTYRSSGAGGQHVNKTESAIRITHIPTAIVVSCQNERSQHKNKDMAMRVLRAKLYEHERQEKEKDKSAVNATKRAIDFGSQIRSYVLHPYQMVKDHRTGLEISNTAAVLDGDLDELITTYLLASAGGFDPSKVKRDSQNVWFPRKKHTRYAPR